MKPWYSHPHINQLVREVHNDHGQYPQEEISEVQSTVDMITNQIRACISQWMDRSIEKIPMGSIVEKTRVKTSLLEFDFMFLVPYNSRNLSIEPIDDLPYFSIDGHPDLNPQTFSDEFLCNIVAINQGNGYRFVVKKRGLNSIVLDVFYRQNKLCEIDIIPAIKITYPQNQATYFIPKIIPKKCRQYYHPENSWLQTNTMEEIPEFTCYHYQDTRLQCLRVLKVICANNRTLKAIYSSTLRNVVLREIGHGYWGKRNLAFRVLKCLEILAEEFEEGFMGKYEMEEANMLDGYNPNQVKKISQVFYKIIESSAAFTDFLEKILYD